MGFFSNLKAKITGKEAQSQYLSGFSKTTNALGRKLRFITEKNFKNKEDFVEQLMITLIESDMGFKTADKICDMLRSLVAGKGAVRATLQRYLPQ